MPPRKPIRRRGKILKPNPFRSGLEYDICKQLKKCKVKYDYEPKWGKLPYIVPATKKTYIPDFYITTKSGKQIIIEAKGIWSAQDRKKHLLVKQQHPELDIRFVFSNSKKKISKVSKTTYADICNGKGRAPFKGYTWKYADAKIPIEWFDE